MSLFIYMHVYIYIYIYIYIYVTNGTVASKERPIKMTQIGGPLVLVLFTFLINYIDDLELKINYL